jgi:adenosylmethionine-8-amino-7-oxononanoate aminotransferase
MHDEPLEIEYIKFDRYYPYGDKMEGETEDEYVSRLISTLENQIQLIGADTIAAIWIEPVSGAVSLLTTPTLLSKLKKKKKKVNNSVIIGSWLSAGRTTLFGKSEAALPTQRHNPGVR